MAKSLEGHRFAVIGFGRSGLGVGRAALSLGGSATVFDSQPAQKLAKPELISEGQALGLDLVLGWGGSLAEGFTEIVVNPAIDPRSELFAELKSYNVPIWSEVEFAYQIAEAPIIGITGTNGKSTTTVLTYLALEACGANPLLCGNLFGSGYPEMTLTDAALSASPDQVLVAEVSSFQLEQIRTFKPVAAAITNISPDHQDRYDLYNDYVGAKHRIFEFQNFGDYAVIPEAGWGVEPPLEAQVLEFGWDRGDAFVHENSLVILGTQGRVPFFNEKLNVLNALTAGLLVGGYYGWKTGVPSVPDEVFAGWKQFKGLAHRLEFVGEQNGVRVINNSMCTNPEALIHSTRSVGGPLRLLIGGVNKGLDFAPVGTYLRETGHSAYLFGRDRDEIYGQIGFGQRFETMGEAFAAAVAESVSGETVILAPGCASTDQFRDFRDRGDAFRTMAQEWLKS